MSQDSQSASIRRYQTDELLSEVAYLEKMVAVSAYTPTASINNLRNRPHIVRLIESRLGGRLIGLAQHSIWAIKHRLPGRRTAGATGVEAPSKDHHAPHLTATEFDAAILTRRPRILIDVTPTFRRPASSGGIPRVVREFAKAAVKTGLALPVYIKDNQLFSYYDHPALRGPIEPTSSDVYVIVDIFWYFLAEYQAIVTALQARKTQIAVIVHDIFPLVFPSFYPEEVPPTFEYGVMLFLGKSDYCLSISRTGQDSIREYLQSIQFENLSRLKFAYFYLGAIQTVNNAVGVRPSIADLFAAGRTFLSVGTLEPRKGYGIALDACDLAWRRGDDVSYVIIGRYGWRSQALRNRILSHPEHGKRLFWIDDASDAELEFAYAHCRSLIQASVAEGFGLPLIEASRLGAPIIASDLPVFREIAGEALTYFSVGEPAALADALAHCLAVQPAPAQIPQRDWSHAMRALAACVTDQAVPPRV